MPLSRRGFLRLLGAAAPLVLTRDFRLPVREIAPRPAVIPAGGNFLHVDIADLTARMATLLAKRLPEGVMLTDRALNLGDVALLKRPMSFRPPRIGEIPVAQRDDVMMRHKRYVMLDPLLGPRDADEWLAIAADVMAEHVARDGVRAMTTLPAVGLGMVAATAVRGQVPVRGVADFDPITGLHRIRFDVLYG